jgi:putative methionine-R-sulfoxide reductase with GAF domain
LGATGVAIIRFCAKRRRKNPTVHGSMLLGSFTGKKECCDIHIAHYFCRQLSLKIKAVFTSY